MALKAGDRVVATRYVGPPFEDAVVIKVGSRSVKPMHGAGDEVPTATIRFVADGSEVEVAADGLRPAPAFYAVKLGDADMQHDSIADVVAAVEEYLAADGASAKDVAIFAVEPGQDVGAGTRLALSDFGLS